MDHSIELAGDLFVAFSGGHERQHLELARADRLVSHVLGQRLGYGGRKAPLSGVNAADGVQQFLANDSLHNISLRSGFKRALYINVTFMGTQDDDAGVRRLVFDFLD